MIEVPLLKRLLALALVVLLATSAVACTREKPAETVTPPTVSSLNIPPSATPALVVPTLIALTTPVTPTLELPTPVIITATATPPPTALPAPVTTTPGTYTVQWGDWINKIAGQFGVTSQAIIAANPGINPNRIYPGQVLNIPSNAPASPTAPSGATPTPLPPPPGPTTYTVQRGDWFYAIARKFGVSVPALQAANPGVNPNFVFPGQVLNIPGSGAPSPNPTPGANPTPTGTGGGTTYTVMPGDTLFSIAVRFRTTTIALQIKNNLANPNFIYPGQVLTIP